MERGMHMIWVLFSLAAALGDAVRGALNKKLPLNEYELAWGTCVIASPILLAASILSGEFGSVGGWFWVALAASGYINVITSTLYVRAVKSSELSVTMPMAAFTPLFLLVTSPLINGEFPGIFGICGIVLIVCGSYLLNISQLKKGLLEPFRALVREPGPRIMLVVAFLWSISSNFDKIGIAGSSPLMWAFSISAFIAVALSPLVFAGRGLRKIALKWGQVASAGVIYAGALLAHATALGLTLVAYAISVKRLSVLFGVLIGGYVFRENEIAAKAAGALIMILGVVLIAAS